MPSRDYLAVRLGALAAGVALAVAACGDSRSRPAPKAEPSARVTSAPAASSTALDLDCENTFAAGQGFIGDPHSRRKPVRLGPVTIARGTAIGGGRTSPGTFISKLPVVLRPDTRVALEIDLGRRDKGGFFSITRNRGGGLVTAPPSAGRRRAYVGPCSPEPAAQTAMGIFITTARRTCAVLTVRWHGHVRKARLRLGVRRCEASG